MGDARAILTDREREIFQDPDSVTDSYFSRVVTKVGDKIDRLDEDLSIFDQHYSDHAERMRGVVCEKDETSLRLDKNTWKALNARRDPGEDLEDVILRILNETD